MRRKSKPVDARRRPAYDEGGWRPLTHKAMTPVSIVTDWALWERIDERVQEYINPMTLKPYGISALCRLLINKGISLVPRLTKDDLLDYIPDAPKGDSGRIPLSNEGTIRLSVAIVKDHVEAVNKRVEELDHPLVGTTSILRFLIRKMLDEMDITEMYKYIPQKHKDHMIEAGMTIKALQDMYQKRQKRKLPVK